MTEKKLQGDGGEAGDALRRLQAFDPKSLVREADLGGKFAFKEAVDLASKVLDIFRQISPSQIVYFPPDQAKLILDQANAFYSLLSTFLSFEIEAQPSPTEAKNVLLQRLEAQYQPIFNSLFPLISYAATRSTDFASLDRDARAVTQTAKDQSSAILSDLTAQKDSAKAILDEVRALATEQGVNKQAIYFKAEADKHDEDAELWRDYTMYAALTLVFYAIGSLFLHKIPGLDTADAYQGAQIAISKVLIFGVIAYVLALCSRNFLSHKHNAIVNRHRQNALATFTALAEATSDAASSDIVLSHAAACIFAPQDTGYIKNESSSTDGVPVLQMLPRVGSVGASA